MAGFLRLWRIPSDFAGKVMNIHPALLPDFGGRGFFGDRVHRAVLDSGATETGCTVHFADNQYDQGPIILQRRAKVLPGDTPAKLADRVFEQERIAYPQAIRLFAARRIELQNGIVRILEEDDPILR
jgi:folate-dependent phosphoribosylglycinamide formyltransferase PurN